MNMTLADNLRGMGFRLCKADPNLWMRRKADYYEYVAVMVDDLLVFSQEPVELIMELKTEKKKFLSYFNSTYQTVKKKKSVKT